MMMHASHSWVHLAPSDWAPARLHGPLQRVNCATPVQQHRQRRLRAAGSIGGVIETDNADPGLLQSALAGGRSPLGQGQHPQRKTIWMAPLRDDEVWYLAYGSNMSPSVLTGRRRVRPEQSLPCYVPGYTPSFAVQGFPWAEPGFATISACSSSSSGGSGGHPIGDGVSSGGNWRMRVCAGNTPCLHAVLHRVNRREWDLIKSSEGVLGGDSSSVGYQVVEVDCVLYDDNTVVKALTLQAAAASLHNKGRDVQPSARYLRLLQTGSRHHGLDDHYQQWLNSLQPYQPPGTLQATLGSLASGAVLLSAASTAVPAYMLRTALGSGSSSSSSSSSGSNSSSIGSTQGQPYRPAGVSSGSDTPGSAVSEAKGTQANTSDGVSSSGSMPIVPEDLVPFLRWYTNNSQRLVWDVHDNLSTWLGSGAATKQR